MEETFARAKYTILLLTMMRTTFLQIRGIKKYLTAWIL